MQDLNITVEEFLSVFYPNVTDTESILIAKPKNPIDPNSAFYHYAVSKCGLNKVHKQTDVAWYACVSTVDLRRSCALGYRSRRQIDCEYARMVFFDDLGDPKKAAKPLPLKLTAMSETSKDNYQGYAKTHPFNVSTDEGRAVYNAYIKGMAAMGYGDPGAGGVERLFRLPGSINKKKDRGNFKTRVVEWNPEVVYDFYELMKLLGVEPIYEKQIKKSSVSIDEIPSDLSDPLLDWLNDNNLIRGGGEGNHFYNIECPWCIEHTTGADIAGYSPLGHGLMPEIRGFNCAHTHCRDRTTKEFIAEMVELGGPNVAANGMAEICVSNMGETDTLNAGDKYIKLRHTLDSKYLISQSDLHDVKVNGDGIPHKIQLPTHANILTITQAINTQIRMNMQTHEPDLSFKNEDLMALAGSTEGVRSAVNDTALILGINSERAVQSSINTIAGYSPYHPAEAILFSEKWDGVSRIKELSDTVQLLDESLRELFTQTLLLWLLQIPQAVLGWATPRPIPYVLTFAGGQGIGKTSWFEALMPYGLFKEGIKLGLSKNNPVDTIREATSVVLGELGELDSTFGVSAMADIKQFLSRPEDEYRIPYSTAPVKYPRSTVYGGSVNHLTFLIDNTGNRRFWPFIIVSANPFHTVNMGQLWAEIRHIFDTQQIGKPDNVSDIWVPDRIMKERLDKAALKFNNLSFTEEKLKEHFDAYTTPGEPKTISDIRDILGADGMPKTKSAIQAFMDNKAGPRRKIHGKRNVWMWPTTPKKDQAKSR